jgi:hypothetical protein
VVLLEVVSYISTGVGQLRGLQQSISKHMLFHYTQT